MCGIAGILNFDGKEADKKAVHDMVRLQKHRGPDDEGSYFGDGIGMAHCRLSIIDVSAPAHQPMSNEDGTKWLVFNGEIYNYIELREELLGLGHVFKSKSDTEVILHAFEEWGERALDRLNGMWAFAIWDSKEKSLFCSRDRFGIKPFYYAVSQGAFIFASEIKALFCSSSLEKHANGQALFNYLSRGYGYIDLDENTFFCGVKQIRPGHCLTIEDGIVTDKEYWRLNIAPSRIFMSEKDIIDRFFLIFEDAVKFTMRSDVPVGISLSGGLDSTSIAMLMPRFTNNKIKSFSAIFEQTDFDEQRYIKKLTDKGLFESFFVSPDPAAFIRDFEKIVWHQDEPFTGASVFSQWEVMKKAHNENIKVLLTGQGSDEILLGYYKFMPYFLLDLIKDGKLAGFINNFSKSYTENNCARFGLLFEMAKIFLVSGRGQGTVKPLRAKAGKCPSFMNEDFFRRYESPRKPETISKTRNYVDKEIMASVCISPLPALLHVDDRNSMAHSVESRPPFLDYRLVEFLSIVPYFYKIKDGYTKNILRAAMKGILDDEVRERKDKMGFVTPAKFWFRDELKACVMDILSSERFKKRGVLEPLGVSKILDSHFKGEHDHSFTIWSWLNLEMWFRIFIDGGAHVA